MVDVSIIAIELRIQHLFRPLALNSLWKLLASVAMSKRRHENTPEKSSKRPKTINVFGVPTAADGETIRDAPSSVGLSRVLPLRGIPSFGSLCTKVFAKNIVRLYEDRTRERARKALKALPDTNCVIRISEAL